MWPWPEWQNPSCRGIDTLDIIDNQLVLMNSIEWRHGDVTVDRLQLEFCIFQAQKHNNLLSSHSIVTKLDMTNNQLLLTNSLDWRHGDVISDTIVDLFVLEFKFVC